MTAEQHKDLVARADARCQQPLTMRHLGEGLSLLARLNSHAAARARAEGAGLVYTAGAQEAEDVALLKAWLRG